MRSTSQTPQSSTPDLSMPTKQLKRVEDGLRLALRACRSFPFEQSPALCMELAPQVDVVARLSSQLLTLLSGLEPQLPSQSKPTTEPPTQ